jgi:Protein of unknown function (DUF5818)
MSKTALATVASVLLLGAGLAAAKDRTFSGEIMDSACGKEGSHEAMMKKAGLTDKGACVKACVKMGGKYVLFDAASKTIYELDDQTKPEEFAGKDVKVTGTLDSGTKTIHVVSIKAA